MTEFFRSMEQAFNDNINQVNNNIMSISTQISVENKDNLIFVSKNLMNNIEFCIKQMELETNSSSEQIKKDLLMKIKRYKQDFEDVRKKFLKCESSYLEIRDKQKLFGARSLDTTMDNGGGGGDTLLYKRSKTEEQNMKLESVKRTAYDSLNAAMDITTTLRNHTDTMEKNLRALKDTNDELSWSDSTINIMKRRRWRNRLLCYSVVMIILTAVFIIIYTYVT